MFKARMIYNRHGEYDTDLYFARCVPAPVVAFVPDDISLAMVDANYRASFSGAITNNWTNPEMNKLLSFNYIYGPIVLMTLMSGCSQDKDAHDHPNLVTGQQLFEYHCADCHQKTGAGNFLKGIPKTKDTSLSVGQIVHKITTGEGGETAMPAFPNMPKEEELKISTYIKSMK